MNDKVCPECNKKLSEFYKDYMLGCPYCYEVFREEILGIVAELQRGVVHTGKRPEINGKAQELLVEYRALKNERDAAKKANDFAKMTKIDKRLGELQYTLKRLGVEI